MAKKASVKFVCSSCGAAFGSWTGRCNTCGEWNTIQEKIDTTLSLRGHKGMLDPRPLSQVLVQDTVARIPTAMPDLDTVLGGGLVPGGVVLLAGEPGIGKSTLLLQVAAAVQKHGKVLYVSGEESAHQVAMRATRLGVVADHIDIASTAATNDIAATIQKGGYQLAIVDSIQTVGVEEISSSLGSVSQITNSTQLLSAAAKASNTALILVGHVTKEGSIAGPKVLEHTVDAVLQLEGDRYGGFKLLRSIKNRFGATGETGIFEMTEKGLASVANPSAALLAERQIADGSVVHATIEGSRALLVEIQALVNPTSYGYPKRAASGFDSNRLNLLIAMLERRTKLKLGDKDIYINVVGGIRLNEPAADLAVVMAIASAAKGMQLKKHAVVFGELGLSGELRHVPMTEKRVQEAKKLGFDGAIGPQVSKKITGLVSVKTVREALNTFLEKE
ncbi:DNA repair protein RadA [bacterium]|nr:DNA repair protein RadA [bacterium]NBX98433.1 DNA repair protein RadA [bacterium]